MGLSRLRGSFRDVLGGHAEAVARVHSPAADNRHARKHDVELCPFVTRAEGAAARPRLRDMDGHRHCRHVRHRHRHVPRCGHFRTGALRAFDTHRHRGASADVKETISA